VPVGLGRGEHDVAGALDRAEQREVLALLRRLGELHVVDDALGAGAAQRVDRARVQRALERPLALEVGERDVVDGHDRDVLDGLGPARLEADGDRLVLDAVEEVRVLGDEGERQRGERRHEDRQTVPAPDHRDQRCRWRAR
jgi:hypothetical protein